MQAGAREVWVSVCRMALLALAAIALPMLVHRLLGLPAAPQDAEFAALLRELVPAWRYDNDWLRDAIELPAAAIDNAAPVRVHRLRRSGAPVALALAPIIGQGYGGPIAMLVVIGADGRLAGARVLAQRETPGYADLLDPARSDWLVRFTGRVLTDWPQPGRARLDAPIDQWSGATISARAVLGAVRRALGHVERHAAALYGAPAQAAAHKTLQLGSP